MMNTAKKTSIVPFTAAKWLCLFLAVIFVFYISYNGHVSSSSFDAVSAAVVGAADLQPMLEGDRQMVRRLYGLNPDDYEGVMLYYPSSDMGAEELLLIQLSSLSQQDDVRTAMETRIASQINVFDGYAPAQVALLEGGIVKVKGNYLLLVVAASPDAVCKAFEAAL